MIWVKTGEKAYILEKEEREKYRKRTFGSRATISTVLVSTGSLVKGQARRTKDNEGEIQKWAVLVGEEDGLHEAPPRWPYQGHLPTLLVHVLESEERLCAYLVRKCRDNL